MNTNPPPSNPYEQNFQKNKRIKILILVIMILIILVALIFAVLLALSLTGIINIPAFQIGSSSFATTS